jgi:hypothetical protein
MVKVRNVDKGHYPPLTTMPPKALPVDNRRRPTAHNSPAMTTIAQADLIESVAAALQYISY